MDKVITEPEPVDCEGTATQTYSPSSLAQSRSTWTRGHQNLDKASKPGEGIKTNHVSMRDIKRWQREVVQKRGEVGLLSNRKKAGNKKHFLIVMVHLSFKERDDFPKAKPGGVPEAFGKGVAVDLQLCNLRRQSFASL